MTQKELNLFALGLLVGAFIGVTTVIITYQIRGGL